MKSLEIVGVIEVCHVTSKTTLNYWKMVERYPNLKEEVGGSIPEYEISSPLDRKLATWSTVSCALALACRPSISQNKLKLKYVIFVWSCKDHIFICKFHGDFSFKTLSCTMNEHSKLQRTSRPFQWAATHHHNFEHNLAFWGMICFKLISHLHWREHFALQFLHQILLRM